MPDFSKCSNITCSIKEKCYRFTVESKEFWQSYTGFKPNADKTCDNFISNK